MLMSGTGDEVDILGNGSLVKLPGSGDLEGKRRVVRVVGLGICKGGS